MIAFWGEKTFCHWEMKAEIELEKSRVCHLASTGITAWRSILIRDVSLESTGLLRREGCAITYVLLGVRTALNLPASPPAATQTGVMGLTCLLSRVLGSCIAP